MVDRVEMVVASPPMAWYTHKASALVEEEAHVQRLLQLLEQLALACVMVQPQCSWMADLDLLLWDVLVVEVGGQGMTSNTGEEVEEVLMDLLVSG
jgi:hypothetical protein